MAKKIIPFLSSMRSLFFFFSFIKGRATLPLLKCGMSRWFFYSVPFLTEGWTQYFPWRMKRKSRSFLLSEKSFASLFRRGETLSLLFGGKNNLVLFLMRISFFFFLNKRRYLSFQKKEGNNPLFCCSFNEYFVTLPIVRSISRIRVHFTLFLNYRFWILNPGLAQKIGCHIQNQRPTQETPPLIFIRFSNSSQFCYFYCKIRISGPESESSEEFDTRYDI